MRIWSGVPNLDVVGGLPRGVTHLYGEDGTFLLDAAYYLAKAHNGPTFWICGRTAEGHELEGIVDALVQFTIAEAGYEAAATCLGEPNALVFIDALPMMQAYKYRDDLEVEDYYDAQRKLTAHALYMLRQRCVANNGRVVLLNESRWSREHGISYHLKTVLDERVEAHIQTKYGSSFEKFGSRTEYSVNLLWRTREHRGKDTLHFFGENERPIAWQYLMAMRETGEEVQRSGTYYKYTDVSGLVYRYGPGKLQASRQAEEILEEVREAYRKTRSRHAKVRSDDRPGGQGGAGGIRDVWSRVQGRGTRFRPTRKRKKR